MRDDHSEQLKIFFSEQARNNFSQAEPLRVQGTNKAKLYRLQLPAGLLSGNRSGSAVCVKRYLSKWVFKLELRALEELSDSGVVCEVIFHSKLLDDYGEGFNGPYFIAKPFFDETAFLYKETKPLVLLERAAQLVHISDALFREGWRDLDGASNNDVVTKDYRVIRVDLDAAFQFHVYPEKFDPDYHNDSDSASHKLLATAHKKLGSEMAEIDSLAIRISRLLLARDASLMELVMSLRRSNGALASQAKWLKWLILKPLWSPETDSSEESDADKIKKKWLDVWKRQFNAGGLDRLEEGESRFLALMFFEILCKEDHSFTTNDLFHSLMMLDLAILKRRVEIDQTVNSPNGHQQLKDRINCLYLTQQFVRKEEATAPLPSAPPLTPPTDERLKLTVSRAGDAWGATKKGSDWKCQDLVLLSPPEHKIPVALLADGVSSGDGFGAVQAIKEVFSTWVKNLTVGSLDDLKQQLITLIKNIHTELLKPREDNPAAREAQLVVISIFESPTEPVVLAYRIGDSQFFIRYENTEGQAKRRYASWKQNAGPTVGSKQLNLGNLSHYETELGLTSEGIYRIRAFSDGIGKPDVAEQLLDSEKRIEDLVQEASQWTLTEHTTHVGSDDWSVAGFDIQVARETLAEDGNKQVERVSPQKPGQADPIQILTKVDPKAFELSPSARGFWTRTLQDKSIRPLASYPILKDKFDLPQQQVPPPPPQTVASNKADNYLGFGTTPLFPRFVFILVGIVSIAGIIIWATRSASVPTTNTNVNSNANRSTSSQQNTNTSQQGSVKVVDYTDKQLEIYRALDEINRVYVKGELPRGDKVTAPPFDTLIPDLAVVLSNEKWVVEIEFHTDPSGLPAKNMDRTTNRAEAFKKRLTEYKGTRQKPVSVNASQITVIPKGDLSPLTQGQSPQEAKKNRRLVIRRKS